MAAIKPVTVSKRATGALFIKCSKTVYLLIYQGKIAMANCRRDILIRKRNAKKKNSLVYFFFSISPKFI